MTANNQAHLSHNCVAPLFDVFATNEYGPLHAARVLHVARVVYAARVVYVPALTGLLTRYSVTFHRRILYCFSTFSALAVFLARQSSLSCLRHHHLVAAAPEKVQRQHRRVLPQAPTPRTVSTSLADELVSASSPSRTNLEQAMFDAEALIGLSKPATIDTDPSERMAHLITSLIGEVDTRHHMHTEATERMLELQNDLNRARSESLQ
jgi:hypothetical protein